MRNINKFANECPEKVHNKVLYTLDHLPKRQRSNMLKPYSVLIVAAIAVMILFGAIWTINPALAQGYTFRDKIASMFGYNPTMQEIVEPPLPAKEVEELPVDITPQETAMLTTVEVLNEENIEEVKVPAVSAEGYIFELEGETVYDGETLIVGFNFRKENCEPMPPEKEYTKEHLAGYIRERELVVGDQVFQSEGAFNLDCSNPNVYRWTTSYSLKDLKEALKNDTKLVLKVAIYDYVTDKDTVFVELPFSVDVSHQNESGRITPIESIFNRKDITIEVEPIICSVTGKRIRVNIYKDGDPEFGKKIDGYLGVGVYDMDGNHFSGRGSIGYEEKDNGYFYNVSEHILDPMFEIPKKFMLKFRGCDLGESEYQDCDPIIIELP